MKRIETQGITYIEPLDCSRGEWYWGSDYASGDLYEAEELFRDGHPVSQNKLIFVHYPDGRVIQPVAAMQGQYFGRPIFHQGKITILLADFPAGKIRILQYDDALGQTALVAEIPRSAVKDCYNLTLETSPLMLIRQGMDGEFQMIWPECSVFIKQFAVLWHFPKYLARSHRTFAREFIQRNVPDEIVADFDIKSALTSL